MEKSHARLVNVAPDGACYYHAVYGSLKAQNLLERVCDILNFSPLEPEFIKNLKTFLSQTNKDEYRDKYYSLFYAICTKIQRLNTDKPVADQPGQKPRYVMTESDYDDLLYGIIDPLPDSLLQLLLKHINNNKEKITEERIIKEISSIKIQGKMLGLTKKEIDDSIKDYSKKNRMIEQHSNLQKFRTRKYNLSQRAEACNNFPAFFADVCRDMMKNSYWATTVETDMVKDILALFCGINIHIFSKESPNLVKLVKGKNVATVILHYRYDNNAIYLYNDFTHYQYFDFTVQPPKPPKKAQPAKVPKKAQPPKVPKKAQPVAKVPKQFMPVKFYHEPIVIDDSDDDVDVIFVKRFKKN